MRNRVYDLLSSTSGMVAIDGDVEHGSVMSGQIAGMVGELMTVKIVVDPVIRSSPAFVQRVTNRLT